MVSRGVPPRQELWAVNIETSPVLAEAVGDALSRMALASTIFSPPRSTTSHIEAIFAGEPDKAHLTATIAVMAILHKAKTPKLHIQKIPDLDWLKKVASDFPPLLLGRWLIYGGMHRTAALNRATNRRLTLQIDATNAFGTGEHPTTQGCLLMLDRVLKRQAKSRSMLDMGCGSGILAMAWAKGSTGLALGIDNDFLSVQIAKNNMRANGLQNRIRIEHGAGYSGRLVRSRAPYDLIMANIFARPLATMAKDLRRYLRPGGVAILSGLLTHQANMVLSAHRSQKIYAIKSFRLGEWSVLVLKKKR